MKQRARLSFIARKKEIPKNENLRFANFQTKFDRYFSYRLLHACEQTIVLFHISRTIFFNKQRTIFSSILRAGFT